VKVFHGIHPRLRAELLQGLQEGKVYFLGWNKDSFLGSGIRFIQWLKYNFGMKKKWLVDKSHSSVLIGIFSPIGKIINRLIHHEALSRGITPNSLSWSIDQDDVEYVDIYEIILPDNIDANKFQEAVHEAYSLTWESVNKPYGFTTIASIFISTIAISIFGYERTKVTATKIGLYDWLTDKLRKNNICSQFITRVANVYNEKITGKKFITDKDEMFVDPEAFESLTNNLVHCYRVYRDV